MPSAVPSITWWNRLEPRPRAPRIAETLAAAVRDPLWLLARQWQFGEFQAEDAGSPAAVELRARLSPFLSWRPPGGSSAPLPRGRPLEAVVEAEPFTPDLATRVELGHTFLALLAERLDGPVPTALRDAFRAAWSVRLAPATRRLERQFTLTWDPADDPAPGGAVAPALLQAFHDAQVDVPADSSIAAAGPGGPWVVTNPATGATWVVTRAATALEVHRAVVPDRDAALFRLVCAGRVVDGVALYEAAGATAEPPPLDAPELPAAQRAAGRQALGDLRAWVADVFGAVGTGDPLAWRPDRLEYGAEVVTGTAEGGTATLTASPDREGGLDWSAFDLAAVSPAGGAQATVLRQTTLPGHVQFRGMPNARWWDFEQAGTDFGAVEPDSRDLAKLVVIDFMLIQGDDWFLLPVQQPAGSLCTVDALLVHDVFGQTFLVERADAPGAGPLPAPGERWSMFSTTAGPGLAGFFLLPPAAGPAVQPGPALEEVRFLRDEGANLVWGVETTTENGTGNPWPGHERDLAVQARPDKEVPPPDGTELRYVLQTSAPENWIPFLPAAVDPVRGIVALERAALLAGPGGLTGPAGRLLAPVVPIREEAVPRTGVTLSRVPVRSRRADGSASLWISRRTRSGAGLAVSGLAFDQALPTKSS
jgi:hypothetical protein